MTASAYHETRFTPDSRRSTLWRALWRYYFSKHILPGHCVIDLGCGYGDFVNAIVARRRIALDVWPELTRYLDPGVEAVVGSVIDLGFPADASVDFAFATGVSPEPASFSSR